MALYIWSFQEPALSMLDLNPKPKNTQKQALTKTATYRPTLIFVTKTPHKNMHPQLKFSLQKDELRN